MIMFQLKRQMTNPVFIVFYVLIILWIIAGSWGLLQLQLSDAAVVAAIVDYDQSVDSARFIEDVRQNDLITVVNIDQADAEKRLQKQQIDILLTIPKHCFSNDQTKIELSYLKSNALAPASLDLFAYALMPQIAKNRLIEATLRYNLTLNKKQITAHYDTIYQSLQDNLTLHVITPQFSPAGRDERSHKQVEQLHQHLMLTLFFIIFALVMPLTLVIASYYHCYARLTISTMGMIRYMLWERLVSWLIIIIPWLVAVASASWATALSGPPLWLLALVGSAVIILHYELFYLLFHSHFNPFYKPLIVLSLTIIPAIIGGVFFDQSFIPSFIRQLFSWLPYQTIRILIEAVFEQQIIAFKLIYFIIVIITSAALLKINHYNLQRLTI